MKYAKTLGIMAIAGLASTAAYAGLTQPAPVVVDLDNGFAQGDMITARDTNDDVTFIGCGVRSIDDGAGGSFEFGFCQAGDENEVQVTCFTQNTALLATMRATGDSSFITFSFVDDGAGGFTCTRIGFSTQSFYLRKK